MIQGGKVIESGTHDALIANGGAYLQLVQDQLASQEDNNNKSFKETNIRKQESCDDDDRKKGLERVLSHSTMNDDFAASSMGEGSSIARLATFCSYASDEGDDESVVDKEMVIRERIKRMIVANPVYLIAASVGAFVFGASFPCKFALPVFRIKPEYQHFLCFSFRIFAFVIGEDVRLQ
jgi:hypothetical protein